jgi:hypothetical protein
MSKYEEAVKTIKECRELRNQVRQVEYTYLICNYNGKMKFNQNMEKELKRFFKSALLNGLFDKLIKEKLRNLIDQAEYEAKQAARKEAKDIINYLEQEGSNE